MAASAPGPNKATTHAVVRNLGVEASATFDSEIGSKTESEFDSGTDSELDGARSTERDRLYDRL